MKRCRILRNYQILLLQLCSHSMRKGRFSTCHTTYNGAPAKLAYTDQQSALFLRLQLFSCRSHIKITQNTPKVILLILLSYLQFNKAKRSAMKLRSFIIKEIALHWWGLEVALLTTTALNLKTITHINISPNLGIRHPLLVKTAVTTPFSFFIDQNMGCKCANERLMDCWLNYLEKK